MSVLAALFLILVVEMIIVTGLILLVRKCASLPE